MEIEDVSGDVKQDEKKLITQLDNLQINTKWKDHPFYDVCKKLQEQIQEHNIDELKDYLQTDAMKFSLMKLHDGYRKYIEPMDNESPVKQEIDGILWYLDIYPYKYSIDPITKEMKM